MPENLRDQKTFQPIFKVTDPMTFAEEVAKRLEDDSRATARNLYAALDDALTDTIEEAAQGFEML
jgi:hypothetical protein